VLRPEVMCEQEVNRADALRETEILSGASSYWMEREF